MANSFINELKDRAMADTKERKLARGAAINGEKQREVQAGKVSHVTPVPLSEFRSKPKSRGNEDREASKDPTTPRVEAATLIGGVSESSGGGKTSTITSSVGAIIGTFAAPGLGTAVGAGAGILVGAAWDRFKKPTEKREFLFFGAHRQAAKELNPVAVQALQSEQASQISSISMSR